MIKLRVTIENYTDKSIYELEKFQYVEYSSCTKYSDGAYSFTLATIPAPKYTKEIFIGQDCMEIEYIEDSNIDIEDLYTINDIGKYTYCLGEEYFVPAEEKNND